MAAERAKTEHFREVGISGEQFAGANEETEPQDNEPYGTPASRTDEGASEENDFADDEDGETIILESSEARALMERGCRGQATHEPTAALLPSRVLKIKAMKIQMRPLCK